jgi:hypothetical protein
MLDKASVGVNRSSIYGGGYFVIARCGLPPDDDTSAEGIPGSRSSSARRTVKYEGGVAVFTATKQGFMVEASVGGQKFSYEELGAKK